MESSSRCALAGVVDVVDGRWSVPDGWQQGRGAWGGLVIAAAVRAAQDAEGSPRPARSVSAQIVAPVVAGEAAVSTRLVRRGSATATWAVDIHSDGACAVVATVVLGDARPVPDAPAQPPQPPSAPPPGEVARVDFRGSFAPPFLQHLDVRLIQGLPYSGTSDDVLMWLGYPDGGWDDAALIALVDGPWPVALVRFGEPRPMATLSFMATLLIDPRQLPPGEPLLYRSEFLGQHEGFLTERRQLWTGSGRLAVENLQLITIIR